MAPTCIGEAARTGRSIADSEGRELLAEAPCASPDRGFEARFELPAERQFFGLGDQTRDRLAHRGTLNELWIRNVTGYIPIPFVLTGDGFGLLVNTTRRLWIDLGHSSEDWFGFRAEGGFLDYYFLYGPSLRETIDRDANRETVAGVFGQHAQVGVAHDRRAPRYQGLRQIVHCHDLRAPGRPGCSPSPAETGARCWSTS